MVLAHALQLQRIADGVLLLDQGRAPAVLEVVDALVAHVGIADAAEVDPDVRHLVDEERAGIDVVDVVDVLPLVGAAPGGIGGRADGMRRRAERQHVEDQGLVVAFPAVGEEARARLGLPAVRKRRATVQHPIPFDALVQELGEPTDLGLVGVGAVEVLRRSEGAGDEERGVDARELGPPRPLAALQVQEVVVETVRAGGIDSVALLARGEEAQGPQRPRRGIRPADEAALHAHRVDRQCHADGGDAGRPACLGLVEHQTVGVVAFVDEITERAALEMLQERVVVVRGGCRMGSQARILWSAVSDVTVIGAAPYRCGFVRQPVDSETMCA